MWNLLGHPMEIGICISETHRAAWISLLDLICACVGLLSMRCALSALAWLSVFSLQLSPCGPASLGSGFLKENRAERRSPLIAQGSIGRPHSPLAFLNGPHAGRGSPFSLSVRVPVSEVPPDPKWEVSQGSFKINCLGQGLIN